MSAAYAVESQKNTRQKSEQDCVPLISLNTQKILEQLETGAGENRFGMKLHAFDSQFAVAQTHDGVVVGLGGNFQLARQRIAFDDQRMIARGDERFGRPRKIVLPSC